MIAQLPIRDTITGFAEHHSVKSLRAAPFNRYPLVARAARLRSGIDIAITHGLRITETGAVSTRTWAGKGQVTAKILCHGNIVDAKRQPHEQQAAYHWLM